MNSDIFKYSSIVNQSEKGRRETSNPLVALRNKYYAKTENEVQVQHLHSFIAAGISCYALALLDELGLLDKLLEIKHLSEHDLDQFPNRLVLRTACITLHKNGILQQDEGKFSLTEFGYLLMDNRGSIGLIYSGYRHILANQAKYATDEYPPVKKHIDSESIAKASIYFGKKNLDPIVMKVLKSLHVNGTICDLGCGAGVRLIELCNELKYKGLGIELSKQAIKLAKQNSTNRQILFKQGDITNLKGIWPDVEVVMQFFVMHDINPDIRCQEIMNSYNDHFPNLKYFLYADVVAPCSTIETQLPGFDYIHSLLGIKTRTYHETLAIFQNTNFEVMDEIYISGLSNTFLWVLKKVS